MAESVESLPSSAVSQQSIDLKNEQSNESMSSSSSSSVVSLVMSAKVKNYIRKEHARIRSNKKNARNETIKVSHRQLTLSTIHRFQSSSHLKYIGYSISLFSAQSVVQNNHHKVVESRRLKLESRPIGEYVRPSADLPHSLFLPKVSICVMISIPKLHSSFRNKS